MLRSCLRLCGPSDGLGSEISSPAATYASGMRGMTGRTANLAHAYHLKLRQSSNSMSAITCDAPKLLNVIFFVGFELRHLPQTLLNGAHMKRAMLMPTWDRGPQALRTQVGALQVSLDRLQLLRQQTEAAVAAVRAARAPVVHPSAAPSAGPAPRPRPPQAARGSAGTGSIDAGAATGSSASDAGSGFGAGGGGAAPTVQTPESGPQAAAPQPAGAAAGPSGAPAANGQVVSAKPQQGGTEPSVASAVVDGEGGGAPAGSTFDDQEELRRRRLERFGFKQDANAGT